MVGAKNRDSDKVRAKVIESTDVPTLQSFVIENAIPAATIYTDDATAYSGLPFDHESVKHSVGEYVREQAHMNGIESFLGNAQTRTHGNLSPNVREAFTEICR